MNAIDTAGNRDSSPLSQDFARALRLALRHLHETRRLATNPLVQSRVVSERTGPCAPLESRVSALRQLLRESAGSLASVSRTEQCHRAIRHTYVEPSPTQLVAAERACMSYGTYRRHLAAGVAEISAALWLREQALSAT